jgi:cellulose synthase/poly-beta-1,6-N-acetylglucosamine synthase-like glycosyltransferase
MILVSISVLLLMAYVGLLLYYRQSWIQIESYQPGAVISTAPVTRLSVIIVARNEEKNIGACLQSLVRQTYPQQLFEIILVDDHSTDATVAIARAFASTNVSVLSLQDVTGNRPLNSYKKKGIEMAIGQATGSLVVTTDADCTFHPQWLQVLASFYELQRPVFIAAPVVYTEPLPGDPLLKKLLQIFQSLDFMTLQGITGASVYKKFHSMCNGANLAYEKQVFYEAGGFAGIDDVASGDDLLLMHKIQKIHPGRVMYIKAAGAIVQTQPVETLSDFMNQRIRWASKADKYTDPKITAVLWLVYVFNACVLGVAIESFFFARAGYFFLLLFLIKTGAELFFLWPVAVFFGRRKLLAYFLPAAPFHIVYILVAGWLGKFGNYTWKGRKVH